MSYLVDTSVWIDFLKNNQIPAVKKLIEVIKLNIPFGITGVIYQEILHVLGVLSHYGVR